MKDPHEILFSTSKHNDGTDLQEDVNTSSYDKKQPDKSELVKKLLNDRRNSK